MQDLGDDELSHHPARARLADQMSLVEDTERQALESIGVLAKRKRAFLRRHHKHVAVRDDTDRFALELRVLGPAEEIADLHALQRADRAVEIAANLCDESVGWCEVKHPAMSNRLRDRQLGHCRFARAGGHRNDRVAVRSGERSLAYSAAAGHSKGKRFARPLW